ncbi:MAG TPA: hypothetical protein VIY48_16230 [Candidatus Paceibacterota bacterium]
MTDTEKRLFLMEHNVVQSGVELIAAEVRRQQLTWSDEHDDTHTENQLTKAAECYSTAARRQVRQYDKAFVLMAMNDYPHEWGGGAEGQRKVQDNPVDNLKRAGALIAREIDRLQRLQRKQLSETIK